MDQKTMDYIDFHREKLYNIQIPQSRLETLVEMENRFFNPVKVQDRGLYDLLLEREREESAVRRSNPAVQKAYEQYRIMLGLSGYTPKI